MKKIFRDPTEMCKDWILIIEDEIELLTVFAEYLQNKCKLNVIGVNSAREALESLENQKFKCVTVDLGLGKDSGERIINFIRKNISGINFNTPVILSSGAIDQLVAKRVGPHINDAIVKPFELSALFEKVDYWMKNQNNIRPLRNRKSSLESPSVLVVDDDVEFNRVTSESLLMCNMKVVSSTSSSETLRKLSWQKFDCIVLDQNLDRLKGKDILFSIREDVGHLNHQTPVLFISGDANDLFIRSLDRHIEAFLKKPFEMKLLVGHLNRLLSNATSDFREVKAK